VEEKIQRSGPGPEETEELSPEQWIRIGSVIERQRTKPGSLIPVLEDIQEIVGYLPRSVQEEVASGLRLPLSEVSGVVSFYSFFTTIPRGKHLCRVCLGTACYVRGGQKNVNRLVELLQVAPGGTTEDREFSLETVRCLGACGLAPVLMVDEDTHKQVKTSKLQGIVDQYR